MYSVGKEVCLLIIPPSGELLKVGEMTDSVLQRETNEEDGV